MAQEGIWTNHSHLFEAIKALPLSTSHRSLSPQVEVPLVLKFQDYPAFIRAYNSERVICPKLCQIDLALLCYKEPGQSAMISTQLSHRMLSVEDRKCWPQDDSVGC